MRFPIQKPVTWRNAGKRAPYFFVTLSCRLKTGIKVLVWSLYYSTRGNDARFGRSSWSSYGDYFAGPEFPGKVSENENRSKIHVAAENKEEAEKIFDGLSLEAKVEAPMGESPWGTYFGMLRDRYGIEWIIECDPNK